MTERVKNGGHNIAEQVIRRRYFSGIDNLFRLYMVEVDHWTIFDNSGNPSKMIACGGKNIETQIVVASLYHQIKSYVR